MSEQTPLTREQIEQLSEDEADQILEQIHQETLQAESAPSEPQEQEAAPEPEPEPEPEPASEPEAEVEAAPEEPAEPEFDVQGSYAKEFELLARRAENAEKRLTTLAGTHGSQVDQLRQTIDSLQQQLLQRGADDAYDQTGQPAPAPTPPAQPQQLGGEAQALRQLLLEQAYSQFVSDIAKDFVDTGVPDDLLNKLTPKVQQQMQLYAAVAQNVGTDKLQSFTRMILDGAYTDYQLEQIRNARAEAVSRKAEQVPKHKQVQAAAISGSGSSSGPPAKPKAVEDWTEEEADAWLEQHHGYRRGGPRRL